MAADTGYIKESLAKTLLLGFYLPYSEVYRDWRLNLRSLGRDMQTVYSYLMYLEYLGANLKYFS